MIRVGLMGFGKAGQAVASVLQQQPDMQLAWVMRQHANPQHPTVNHTNIPMLGLDQVSWEACLEQHPIDALIDFSKPEALHAYAKPLSNRGIDVVTAISAYTEDDLKLLRNMGEHTRVLSSPNITLGINFLMLAAGLLRRIAPFADVEIVEQHFREKPEVSGTARKIAEKLELTEEQITSLRIGGIVGHHEVIFGFPHQTVRLTHESIRREAFGTGAAYALRLLHSQQRGFYTFEELLLGQIKQELLKDASNRS
jgi:4-hydroxy-tetrahydrodipicolinate reductase